MNPATGVNTRLEDFVNTLSICIDRALTDVVDMVIFGGDAFPDATPPPYVQQAFASQFRRLMDANIPTVLLVGNHDQHSQGQGGASLNIYRTLGVPGFVVGDTLTTHCIETRNGKVQVITLPWLTRSTLMTRQETEGLSLAEVNQLLTERLRVVLEGEIRRLDPDVPTILLAHLMSDNATLGAERFLAVGKGFTLPLSLLTRPCFDYVALGHVHRHQNLNKSNNPPVIYPGSIERVDFSEEKEDKGYVMLELERGKVEWEFCPLTVRTFQTIEVDISKADDPQAVLMKAIAKYNIEDAVVRLIYKLRSEQMDLIDSSSLHTALSPAHTYTIQAELVSQLARPRIPELSASSSIDPMEALKTYLNNREDLKDIAKSMMDAAHKLLADEVEVWLEAATNE
ncbi:exonuclease sbcCD subunit D [Nostoc punctiforme NIES-2108]|uniref:Nuclease SbcCD subunit D n=1 Tax=Nostoc punctiforme NIES-2108 TaxID=1356359 RepID=A0A367R976_NOSPU|nr:exonuclease sbcCD subunit D [Nostoc punctiforme NIES-2108]